MSPDRSRVDRAPEREHLIGGVGPALLHRLAAGAGMVFRDISGIDLGIDAQIELFEGRKAQGSVLLQIKGTAQSRITRSSCRIENVHAPDTVLRYWLSLRAPVVLIQVGLEEVSLCPGVPAYFARWLTAVDVSWESLVPKGEVITWKRKAEKDEPKKESRRHVLRLVDLESPEDVQLFREWLLSVRGRSSSPNLAKLQAKRSLDAAEFELARSLVRPWHKSKEPWAQIQMCRIARREDKWDPCQTEKELKSIATGQKGVDRSDALKEIGYSYLVAATKQQIIDWRDNVSVSDHSSWKKGVEYLKRWVREPLCEPETEQQDQRPRERRARRQCQQLERAEYLLYAYQVALAMNVEGARTELERVVQEWTEQTKNLSPQTDIDAVANGNLRHALLTNDRAAAVKWMGKVWALFQSEPREAPGVNRRSAQDFAGALLWKAWTLALDEDPGARKTFEAAETAIGGVLWYPEMMFWVEAARRALPDRFPPTSASATG